MDRRRLALNGILTVAAVGLGAVGYTTVTSSKSSAAATSSTSTVKKGIVLSSVSASGNVISPQSLSVSFSQTGIVSAINVKVGDVVAVGQPLAKVDDSTQRSALQTAQAQLAVAKAQLTKLKSPLTSADRAQIAAQNRQSQLSIVAAQASLDNAKVAADNDVVTLQTAVDQANANVAAAQQQAPIDAANAQSAIDQAQATLNTANNQYQQDSGLLSLQTAQLITSQALYDPNKIAGELTGALLIRYQSDQDSCNSRAVPNDGVTCAQLSTLIRLAQAVQAAEKTSNADQAAVNQATNALTAAKNNQAAAKIKSDQSVLAAQTAVTNAINNQKAGLLKDQQAIAAAQRGLDQANASYAAAVAGNNVKAAPPDNAALLQQEAQIEQASVAVTTAQKNLDDTTLKAPVAGTVAAIAGTVGVSSSGSSSSASSSSTGTGASSTSSSSGFLTLTNLSSLEVKAGFSETDVAKLKVGAAATVTLDAVPTARITGKIVQIDTNQTVVSNVVTYYALVALDNVPPAVKVGMTASAQVVVDKRDDVLYLPVSAVTGRGTTANVRVKAADGTITSKTITVGLRGDDSVEVTGLNVGDQVITTRTASATATANRGGFGGGAAIPGGAGGALAPGR
ncbi:MAG: secretion protein HlyD family protein [Acidimicrobiia bacterium]|nr:secretion protein HlyD family protein [Acidimicrobiia bacterium]